MKQPGTSDTFQPPKHQAITARSAVQPPNSLWYQIKRNKWPYFFISPFFVLFAIFGLFPPLFGFYLSFHQWDGLSPKRFVGLDNYIRVINDQLFWKSFTNTVGFIFLATLPMLALAIIIAFLLDSYVKRFRNFFLATYFSPMVTSSVAVTIIFGLMYGTNFGLINSGLRLLGLAPIRWLTDPLPMKVALALLLIWRYLGWNIVLYLVGLQTISHDYYDAARVDGANGVQILFRIVVPLMRPTILYTLIISIIGVLQLFGEPYLLTVGPVGGSMGGRDNALLTMAMYLYQNGFGYFRFGYAAAIAYVMFALILIMSFVNLKLIGRSS